MKEVSFIYKTQWCSTFYSRNTFSRNGYCKSQQTFTVKVQIVNILGFVVYIQSATILFFPFFFKTFLKFKKKNFFLGFLAGCIKTVMGQIWPKHYSLPLWLAIWIWQQTIWVPVSHLPLITCLKLVNHLNSVPHVSHL